MKIMKTLRLLIAVGMLLPLAIMAQTTATDFTVNDCSGNSRHLFGMLDSGKVVVMSFVHPCSSCVGPTKNAQNVVNSFASSHAGRVIMFIVDDAGDNSCSSISSWCNQFGISGVPVITNTAVVQTQYGAAAMPKIVVVAGTDHKVYFKEDNGLNTTNLTSAINTALAASGVERVGESIRALSLSPNPASRMLNVSYFQSGSQTVTGSIHSILGNEMWRGNLSNSNAGQQEKQINIDALPEGFYFLTIESGNQTVSRKFTIVR